MGSLLLLLVALSELMAAFLIGRIWISAHHVASKVLFSIGVLVPVLGPLMFLWIYHAPPPQPESLQNRSSYGGYTQRMLPVLERRAKAESRRLGSGGTTHSTSAYLQPAFACLLVAGGIAWMITESRIGYLLVLLGCLVFGAWRRETPA